MEKYDYRRAITDEIKDWIVNNTDLMEDSETTIYDDDIANWIYDEVWCEDSITGNGAYYYDTEDKCSEYLCHNLDLVCEALRDFGMDENVKAIIKQYENKSLARYFDCTVRCYLLGECIEIALEELKNEQNV